MATERKTVNGKDSFFMSSHAVLSHGLHIQKAQEPLFLENDRTPNDNLCMLNCASLIPLLDFYFLGFLCHMNLTVPKIFSFLV